MYATIVAFPRVPEEAWIRTHSSSGTWSSPNGYASRSSDLTRNGCSGSASELDAEPLPQPLALEPLELRPRQRLELGLEDRHGADYSLSGKRQWIDQGGGVRAAFMSIEKAVDDLLGGMDACFAERSTLGSWRM